MRVNQSAVSAIDSRQNANCVVMVPPKEFQFNQETASDNEFQIAVTLTPEQVTERVMREYRTMVTGLRANGVQVIEFDYPLGDSTTPDAVFPNNWFNTQPNGNIATFPMACKNRQSEVRVEALLSTLEQQGRKATHVEDLTHWLSRKQYLESTGVMVMDHVGKCIYAALSQRCDREVLDSYALSQGYEVVAFSTELPSGSSVYHTNVMMSVGESFAVICDEVIPEFERRMVLKSLAKTKQVISITQQQMSQFCGNLLQLENARGEKCIAMSQSAYDAFTSVQKSQLSTHGKLLAFDVSTIETIGGGSVRCMLAEVFLPQS
ncbi:arginine deiminase-related protein [Vibrio agarivorans]|uniref:Arginine deiminase-related protein n=1 Tax=Vibrio agarivorans TaxID=153622 RepID=A0ABT7Y392_9VIBR|nr:arginine deiminase-related protein [Vibrio agarivorans]MDN2482516.1 arginine deiminase-related protein [Vibrio agarivorans]